MSRVGRLKVLVPRTHIAYSLKPCLHKFSQIYINVIIIIIIIIIIIFKCKKHTFLNSSQIEN